MRRTKTGLEYKVLSSEKKLTFLDALLFGMALFLFCLLIAHLPVLKVSGWFYALVAVFGFFYFGIHYMVYPYRFRILLAAHLAIFLLTICMQSWIRNDIHTILYATQIPIEIHAILVPIVLLLVVWLFTLMFVLSAPFIIFLCLSIMMTLLTMGGWTLPSYILPIFFLFLVLLLSRRFVTRETALFLCGLSMAIFLISWTLAPLIQSPLSSAAIQLEENVTEILRNQNTSDRTFSSGIISHGNNYARDTELFTVEANFKPQYPIYIKNFTGVDYQDSQWIIDDEKKLTAQIQKNYGDYISPYEIRSDQSRIERERARKAELSSQKLTLHPQNDVNLQDTQLYHMLTKNEEDREILFQFYPDYAYTDHLDTFTPSNSLIEFETVLHQSVQTVYTQVDTDSLSSLYSLVKANPINDLDTVTAFIVCLLQENTTYTRTPGYMPWQEDATESFLFRQKKGYCVHYASAAALLYRMYNIPCRYATGYVVYPQDFQKEKESYQATIPENRSHAWIELYLDAWGWVPVDMTPNQDGEILPVYPGMDIQKLKNQMENNTFDFRLLHSGHLQNALISPFERMIPMIVFTASGLLFLYKWLRYRQHKTQKRKQSAQEILQSLLTFFHQFPSLQTLRYDQNEFTDIVHQHFPFLSCTRLQKIQNLAQQVLYSNHCIDTRNLFRLCQYCQNEVEKTLPLWKRLYYRYWKQIL